MRQSPALAPAFTLALLLPATALADPIDGRTARDLLYRDVATEVVAVDVSGLSAQEVTVLTTVVQTQKYYAAVAFAPDAGIMAEPTVLAANHHAVEFARTAALDGCNARRSGGRACVIALELRPTGWEERALSLSADATAAFDSDYRGMGRRAFAVSLASGQWGIGRGRDAAEEALNTCRADSDVSDCAVIIAD